MSYLTEGDEAAYHTVRRGGPMRVLILEIEGQYAFVEVEWLPTPHRTRRVVPMYTLSPWTYQDDEYWHSVRERQREEKAREAEYLKRMAALDAKKPKSADLVGQGSLFG